MDKRQEHKLAYEYATSIIYRRNASAEEIKYAILQLPKSGNKAAGLRLRLERKQKGLPTGWEYV
jgi:hypothetical protein